MTDPTPLCRCGHDVVWHRTSRGLGECNGCKLCPDGVKGPRGHKYEKCDCEKWSATE